MSSMKSIFKKSFVDNQVEISHVTEVMTWFCTASYAKPERAFEIVPDAIGAVVWCA